MTQLSEVSSTSIIGNRAPYLGFSPNMFQAMAQNGLTYDSSMACCKLDD
jgi:hypothetical protein